ncbi:hypothetical protein WT01_19615 [Burkholderia cepacia]|uniref:two-partner secretion domain-containing protein n=1 Tax=Burkholderia cepacia TaxID=292 RepID=UPI0007532CC0|nr:GLUG motif-containing protein [Burkholderia cepacia]KVL57313.1 hypothetical protein WT01_19615 [Burkholderia cepacia]
MNNTYSLVWNDAQGGWCAVGETARRRGKGGAGRRLLAAGASLLGLAATGAHALPTGGEIVSGKGDIATSADGKAMSINQHTDKLITNWQDFGVDSGERVSFRQPTERSIALNRVLGTNGSQIHGRIDANGRVFVVNPNGVVFGAGAQVDVGWLVASTKNVSDADFLAGRYRFSGASGQSVENAGTITAADGGSVALLGARVSNAGVIRATAGRVALAAGDAFDVNFDGSGLLNLRVERGAVDALARNGGLLKADGGEVLMTARAANGLLDAVVANSGTVEAHGLRDRGGRITLDGGQVQVGGALNAAGGAVTTRGEQVSVSRDAQVDTRTASGGAGQWTIEAANAGVGAAAQPGRRGLVIDGGLDGHAGGGSSGIGIGIGGNGVGGGTGGNGVGIVIGGGSQGGSGAAGGAIDAATLSRNLGTTNVALTATSGDLKVADAVSWTSGNTLALTSQKGGVDLNAALTASGAGAGVTVNATQGIAIGDLMALTGERARLELNSANGHRFARDGAAVTLSGRGASFSSNGDAYRVIRDTADLRDVDGNLAGRYVLGNAIDGNGETFGGIGSNAAFDGVFDGLGNTISRLNVTGDAPFVGLFAVNRGRIANLALDSLTVRGASRGVDRAVGGLAGANRGGTISNVRASAMSVALEGRGQGGVGGLVGENDRGVVDGARFQGRVFGDDGAVSIGGIAGQNLFGARIANSRADAEIASTRSSSDGVRAVGGLVGMNWESVVTDSSSGGRLSVGDAMSAGGLVGIAAGGAVERSSTSSSVTAGASGYAGGAIGWNAGAEISGVAASGRVDATSGATVGGLIGHNDGGVVRDASASGSVAAGAGSTAGGFVGHNDGGEIRASVASGNVSGTGSAALGGFAGSNGRGGVLADVSASGRVRASAGGSVGGLAGVNDGTISGALSSGAVRGGADSIVGGLVGVNHGIVAASRSSSSVTAADGRHAGGLVGENSGKQAVVSGSSASGAVAAGRTRFSGGFAGWNDAGSLIVDSDASGTVSTVSSFAGGFVGLNGGTIRSSRTSARIDYPAGGRPALVGGFVATNTGRIESSRTTGAASAEPFAGFNVGMIDRRR